jgi:hypothetical protein
MPLEDSASSQPLGSCTLNLAHSIQSVLAGGVPGACIAATSTYDLRYATKKRQTEPACVCMGTVFLRLSVGVASNNGFLWTLQALLLLSYLALSRLTSAV